MKSKIATILAGTLLAITGATFPASAFEGTHTFNVASSGLNLFAKVVKPVSKPSGKPPSKQSSRPHTGCQKNVAKCVNNAAGAASNVDQIIQNHKGK